jgi:hypothetical protein
MSTKEIERKIAVIFATDVVGYSKHMEADETETVKNLRACEKYSLNSLKSMVEASLIQEVTLIPGRVPKCCRSGTLRR